MDANWQAGVSGPLCWAWNVSRAGAFNDPDAIKIKHGSRHGEFSDHWSNPLGETVLLLDLDAKHNLSTFPNL